MSADDNESVRPAVVQIDRKAFTLAVENCLIAATKARSPEGALLRMHPSPFRMAMEVREALRRACGFKVEVQDWEELILEIKPPFPNEQTKVLSDPTAPTSAVTAAWGTKE